MIWPQVGSSLRVCFHLSLTCHATWVASDDLWLDLAPRLHMQTNTDLSACKDLLPCVFTAGGSTVLYFCVLHHITSLLQGKLMFPLKKKIQKCVWVYFYQRINNSSVATFGSDHIWMWSEWSHLSYTHNATWECFHLYFRLSTCDQITQEGF